MFKSLIQFWKNKHYICNTSLQNKYSIVKLFISFLLFFEQITHTINLDSHVGLWIFFK